MFSLKRSLKKFSFPNLERPVVYQKLIHGRNVSGMTAGEIEVRECAAVAMWWDTPTE